jgi:predicted TIM-barrel fold metal-dependent hydrolase
MMKRRAFIASTLASTAAASLPRHSFAAAQPLPFGFKLFDTHAHFYTYEPDKYAFVPEASRYGPERMIAKAKEFPMNAEAVFKFWDSIGCEMGTAVQYSSTYGTDNSYLLAVCRANPKRVMPVVILTPTDAKTPELLLKWAKEERLAGIRWTSTSVGAGGGAAARGGIPSMLSPESEPSWAVCNDLGLSIVLMRPGAALGEVARFAVKYPNVKITLDHIAFPQPELRPATFGLTPEHYELAKHKNVYYKLTNYLVSEMEAGAKAANKPMVALKPFVEHMFQTFGADHLCWGSDKGNVEVDDFQYTKNMVDATAGLSAKDRQAFFYDTAKALFVPGGRGKKT